MVKNHDKDVGVLENEGKLLTLLYQESEELKDDLSKNANLTVVSKLSDKLIKDFVVIEHRHSHVVEVISHWFGDFEEQSKVNPDNEQVKVFMRKLELIREGINTAKGNIERIINSGNLKGESKNMEDSVDNICSMLREWLRFEKELLDLVPVMDKYVAGLSNPANKLKNYQSLRAAPMSKLADLLRGLGYYSTLTFDQRRDLWNRWVKSADQRVLKDIDLSGVKLEGFVFIDFVFKNVIFKGAHLEEAHLEGAHLERADLEKARLWGAHLEKAHLWEARLWGAHLEEAHLWGANLWGAYFWGAHLEGAHLEGTRLKSAHLEGVHLEGAHLEKASLGGARLWEAHLEGANLEEAHLEKAHLEKAHLEKAIFPEKFKYLLSKEQIRQVSKFV